MPPLCCFMPLGTGALSHTVLGRLPLCTAENGCPGDITQSSLSLGWRGRRTCPQIKWPRGIRLGEGAVTNHSTLCVASAGDPRNCSEHIFLFLILKLFRDYPASFCFAFGKLLANLSFLGKRDSNRPLSWAQALSLPSP